MAIDVNQRLTDVAFDARDPVQTSVHAWLNDRYGELFAESADTTGGGVDKSYADTLLLIALTLHQSIDQLVELDLLLTDVLGFACTTRRNNRMKAVFTRTPLDLQSLRKVSVGAHCPTALAIPDVREHHPPPDRRASHGGNAATAFDRAVPQHAHDETVTAKRR